MGPEWLSHHEEKLNDLCVPEHIPQECLTEMTSKNQENLKLSTLLVNINYSSIGCVVDISCLSNLQCLLQVTAYVLRFLKNLKARLSRGNKGLVLISDTGLGH